METPEVLKGIDWKALGKSALKETGRVVLNVVAMFGALALFGKVAKES